MITERLLFLARRFEWPYFAILHPADDEPDASPDQFIAHLEVKWPRVVEIPKNAVEVFGSEVVVDDHSMVETWPGKTAFEMQGEGAWRSYVGAASEEELAKLLWMLEAYNKDLVG